MRRYLLGFLLCLGLGTYCKAEVLASTFGPGYEVGTSAWVITAAGSHPEAMGVPFTPSHSSILNQIDLGFYSYAPVNNLQIDLTTNNWGAPGTVLESWRLTLNGAYTGPYVKTLFSVFDGPVFQGGTQYWIFVSGASTYAGWFSNPMGYQDTVAFNMGSGWFTSTLDVPVFDVIGSSSPIPEPNGILMLATGLAGSFATGFKKFFR
jgi:hypothetical protein